MENSVEEIASASGWWSSLVLPLLVIVIYTVIKYGYAINRKDIKIFHLLAELPIDFLSVGSTLLIASYIISQSPKLQQIHAMCFLLLTLLVTFGCTTYRTYINELIEAPSTPDTEKAKSHIRKLWIFVIVWFVLILTLPLWISYIY